MSGFDDDFGEMVESKAEANLMVSLIMTIPREKQHKIR